MKQFVYWKRMDHPQWHLYIAATKDGLCYVGSETGILEELLEWVRKRLPNYIVQEDMHILKVYEEALINYLEGSRDNFSLPMDLYGTEFQQKVWQAVQKIPYGQTVSYSDIAEIIQKPNALRAVGTAIGANPVPIIIPCHRVIAKNGKLGGYSGGLEMKKKLLLLEKESVFNFNN